MRTNTYYRICPDCGAYLDPGEPCDCYEERGVNFNDRCGTGSTGGISARMAKTKPRQGEGLSIEILGTKSRIRTAGRRQRQCR